MKKQPRRNTLKNIQKRLFRTQMILILTLAVFLGGAGILLNIYFENQKRDQNLQNVAEAIAQSPLAVQSDPEVFREYLDSLKESLGDIDVLSVINTDNTRRYHSDHGLIGSVYDGTQPSFSAGFGFRNDCRNFSVSVFLNIRKLGVKPYLYACT